MMPTAVTVEIEFSAGVWTDVSTYLDGSAGGSTQFGRQSAQSSPSPGTLSLTLDNSDGRFTPGRQTLADGSAHPYWPNLVPRKRIRLAYVVAGVSYYRFTGYISGWPPAMLDGTKPRVQIQATTQDARLALVTLLPSVPQEIDYQRLTAADPRRTHYWPLTEPVGSLEAEDAYGGVSLTTVGGTSLAFGADGLTANGTAVSFTPSGSSSGQRLTAAGIRWTVPFAIHVWINAGTTPPAWFPASGMTIVSVDDDFGGYGGQLKIDGATGRARYVDAGGSVTGGSNLFDGNWHLLSMLQDGSTGTLYVDGASVATMGGPVTGALFSATVGVGAAVAGAFNSYYGRVAHPHLITDLTSYTAAQEAALYLAGRAGLNELADARVKRFLSYGGLSASDWAVDASTLVLNTYDQSGVDVITACQDVVASEGGGSVFYIGTDGKAQFRNRGSRKPAAPVLSVDAEADLDGSQFDPVYDDTQIVNQVQGSRASASGAQSTVVVSDAASQAAYGPFGQEFTSYAKTTADVRDNAQDRLVQQRNPAYRLGQLTVDLATATTPGLYAAVAGTDIGERIRVTNLPVRAAPATQIDALVEGWADTFGSDGYSVAFDSSPADNPAQMVWDDTTYGRWGCESNTLSTSLTNSATTVVIATAAGKATFTTTSARYPLGIAVATENIQLNGAPGGATSPQTFTGATRGFGGTAAAAQSSGAAVTLATAPTWTL